MYNHIPVLLKEVMEHLKPEPNHILIDGTVGQAGHAHAFMQRALPEGRLLGIDRDETNLDIAKQRLAEFGERVVLIKDSYANTKTHAYAHQFTSVNAILLDVGFSSAHIDDPKRGFSFALNGPLDMRYDRDQELTAEEIVNNWDEDELAKVIRLYGEDRNAARIVEAIVAQRKIRKFESTGDLAECIAKYVRRTGKIHPATKTFQALRIVVNDELGQLERALPELVSLLAGGGRIGVISFHSLEDRIVKQFFKSCTDLDVITKRPVTATQEERRENPRARSAKLRVAQKT